MPLKTHNTSVSQSVKIQPPLEIESLLTGKTVWCSFSGGSDSMALLYYLKEQEKKIGFQLQAVHFEHGFRGEASLDDAAFCQRICQQENIPFQLFHIDAPTHKLKGEGDEEAARRLRLDYWKKIIFNPENSLIALGHHAGDRMENIFLRLFRGSNCSGLSSMRPVQKIGVLTLIRPFIETSRHELELFLRERGITEWCHDATNEQIRYRRNFVRHELLPRILEAFPFASGGIRQSLRTLQSDAECLEQLAAHEFKRLSPSFKVKDLQELHPALRARVLRIFLQDQLRQPAFVPDSNLLERFEELLSNPRPAARIPLPGVSGCYLIFQHEKLTLLQRSDPGNVENQSQIWDPLEQTEFPFDSSLVLHSEVVEPEQLFFSRDKSSACFDLDLIAEQLPLQVTYWQEGDRMIPYGKKSPVRLKKLFADVSVNTAERKYFPVIRLADGEILWVVCLRNSAIAPVTAETHRVLRLFVTQKQLQHHR